MAKTFALIIFFTLFSKELFSQQVDTVVNLNFNNFLDGEAKIKKDKIILKNGIEIKGRFRVFDTKTDEYVDDIKSLKRNRENKTLALFLNKNSRAKNEEDILVKLTSKLKKHHIYRIELRCKAANNVNFITAGLGCLVRSSKESFLYSYFPQVMNPYEQYISNFDTGIITGKFSAFGGEDVIEINEFFPKRKVINVKQTKTNYHIYQLLVLDVTNETKNLIVNGDFEAINKYPVLNYKKSQHSNINLVPRWAEFTIGTPDLYNNFVSSSKNLVMNDNLTEIRKVSSNKSNFMGFCVALKQNKEIFHNNEKVATRLKTKLVAGRRYKFSIRVLASDKSSFFVKNMGIGFLYGEQKSKNDAMKSVSHNYIEDYSIKATKSYIISDSVINNTKQWKLIEYRFTADGGESIIIIGGFDEDEKVFNNSSIFKCSYYYFDDIKLLEIN